MNVFGLCTGRCGSVTLSKALSHCTNYSVGHESTHPGMGPELYDFQDNHIEIDCRLAWRLGRLGKARQGKETFYIHLTRDPKLVARSFHRKLIKGKSGLARAWYEYLGHPIPDLCGAAIEDMVLSVTENIELFLADKDYIRMDLAEAKDKFPLVWSSIEAEGNIDAALAEFDIKHNQNDYAMKMVKANAVYIS